MVRVVSCHHFISQDVFLSESEPVAFCGAQNKLLLSTVQHTVNVHDLEARGNVLHSFPTVDIVKQIIYCESGNYVATIENKISWQKTLASYVRVYFQWWIDTKGQPLKVRAAGGIPTFSSTHSGNKSLEMVELPLESPALYISSCNKTSSLSVSLGNIISVFCYSTKIHFPSKQTFDDFDHFVDIHLPFVVQELDVCENYFACMSDKCIHVFKIASEIESIKDKKEQKTIEDCEDSDVLDENYVEWRFESCTGNGAVDVEWESHLKSKLHPNSFPINLRFHAIDKENETFQGNDECEYYGPVLTVRGCSVELRLDPKVFEMFPTISSNVYAVTLLFRQFAFQEKNTKLTALQLVPFYKSEPLQEEYTDPLNAAASKSKDSEFSFPWPSLLLSLSSSLKAIGCFVSTSKEGFLYSLTNKVQFVSSYAYTSTMKGVVLDNSLLHALTETGLETYTVHLSHAVFPYLEEVKTIVPGYEDTVCLLGLRPFLGVDHLVKSDNHLVLVSSVEDSVANTESGGNRSTLYSLKEPSSAQVFTDLLEVAENQKSSSPSTYCHLLSEAHMILRTDIFLGRNKDKEIDMLYKKSCLMLADYFLCSDAGSRLDSVPYYCLSQLPAENIIKRILDFRNQMKQVNLLQPLVVYLNLVLFEESKTQLVFSQSITDSIFSVYSDESPEVLWKIVLCSNLKGYKVDKAILMLKRRMTNKKQPLSPISNAADTTALVYLLLQKGTIDAAQNMISSLSKGDLLAILSSIHNKLWDEKSFSKFGKFIKQHRPDAFVELLLGYVDAKRMKVSEILQILQSEASNSELHRVPLLKEFLEAIVCDQSMIKEVESSVLNLLVKIYLKRLIEPSAKSPVSSNPFSNSICSFSLFFGSRPNWLNEMPPFMGKGISKTCLLSPKSEKLKINDSSSSMCSCWNCNEDLLRLQSLLSYLGPSDDLKGLVLDFLGSAKEKTPNWLSLEVMCLEEMLAIKLLVGMSPKALLPYATETFHGDNSKWSLLFSTLQEHVMKIPDDHPNIEIYSQTFHAVLAHLAENLGPVDLLALLPKGENDIFLPHVKRCVEKHQANQLKVKIVSLGQEIKSMMLT